MITILATSPYPAKPDTGNPRLWGMDPMELHDRYWRAQGAQVVRRGVPAPLEKHALFLLTDAETLTILPIDRFVSRSWWRGAKTWLIRLNDSRPRRYREMILSDEDDRFLGLRRIYAGTEFHAARVVLTPDAALAEVWQKAPGRQEAWRLIRRCVPRSRRITTTAWAPIYHCGVEDDLIDLVCDLPRRWSNPGTAIDSVRQITPGVWCDADSRVESGTILIAPAWIGRERHLEHGAVVAGPVVLWDAGRGASSLDTHETSTYAHDTDAYMHLSGRRRPLGKRLFDVLFALLALACSLPFYPLVMLAIWLEDGRPFLFSHQRETRGGVQFPCLKFRSMRNDAEAVKASLAAANLADGPQFFLQDDPRLTRVGRFLRNTNIDELPQFWNVLLGHMSVVGPRPSPRKENQFCPPWREARLSVRPGIVGLWQIRRSRAAGLDFQEWIRFDIEYIENQSWRLDLWIIWRAVLLLGFRRKPKIEPAVDE